MGGVIAPLKLIYADQTEDGRKAGIDGEQTFDSGRATLLAMDLDGNGVPTIHWYDPEAPNAASFRKAPRVGELQVLPDGGYTLAVLGGNPDIFLNGRKIEEGRTVRVREGDLVRVLRERNVVGSIPEYPRNDLESEFLRPTQPAPPADEAGLSNPD